MKVTVGKFLLALVLIVSLFLVSFDAWTELVVGLYTIKQLIILLTFSLAVIILIISFLIYKNRFRTIPLIISLSLLAGYITAKYSNEYFAQERKKNAYKIINGILTYYKANNTYPTSLNEIVPNYINHIPRMRFGLTTREYEYFKSSIGDKRIEDFSLTWYNSGEYITYNSMSKKIIAHPLPW